MRVDCCCIEWEQEIILYLDNELSLKGRDRVEKHLKKCNVCARFCRDIEREEHLIAGSLRHEAETYLPAAAFTNAIMNALPEPGATVIRWKITESVLSASRLVFRQARRHVAVAASLLICFLGTLVTLSMGDIKEEQSLHIKRNKRLYPCTVQEPLIITRPEGEFFEFPDGTVVYATYGTWFTIDSYQDEPVKTNIGKDRQLGLKFGELFLDVHPAREGFTITCANTKAKVFGTQFYISTSAGLDKMTTVAVREGQVMVEKRNLMGYTVVKPGEMTRVYGRDNRIVLDPPDSISSTMLKKLNWFNEARGDSSAQRLVPFRSIFDRDNLTSEPDPFSSVEPTSFAH